MFTGFLIQIRVAEAKEQQYKAEQNKRYVSNQIAFEVTDAYPTMRATEQATKVAQLWADAARGALSLAEERYRLGLSSIVEVTSAAVAATAAEVRLADAQYQFKASEVALDYAIGRGYRVI